MKKILLPAVFAASTIFGAAGLANAAGSGHGEAVYPPPATEEVSPPVVTVPPAPVVLPVTGADSSNTLAISAVAVGVGGGLVLVARSRRRRPAQPTV